MSAAACGRFSPQLRVLNYSAGKEAREEEQARIIKDVSAREWNRAKFPFHILLAHYEVWLWFCISLGSISHCL